MIVWLVLAAPAHAEVIAVASVVDADTTEIQGQRIRLHGIDAPESSQTCLDDAGQKGGGSAGGPGSGGRTITCDERDVDRYGRIIGRCLIGGLDINEWRVAQGFA